MPDTTTQPFEMTLGDGTVVKGANIEEAFKTLADMKVNTAAALKAEREQREALAAEKQRYESELQALRKPVQTNNNGFDNQKYYTLLNENPIEAQNYMDRFRFGVDDPVSAFNSMRQQVDVIAQQNVAAAFTASHSDDFPPTPEAARALTQRTQSLVQEGYPYNLRTVEMAYRECLADGSIKPLERQAPEETYSPPPSLTGAGGGAAAATQDLSEISKLEKMSTTELEAYLKSKGILR